MHKIMVAFITNIFLLLKCCHAYLFSGLDHWLMQASQVSDYDGNSARRAIDGRYSDTRLASGQCAHTGKFDI